MNSLYGYPLKISIRDLDMVYYVVNENDYNLTVLVKINLFRLKQSIKF